MKRNTKHKHTFILLIFVALFLPVAHGADKPAKGSYLVYVGTYTGPESKGIYAFRFDLASGKSTSLELAGETTNPSFVAIDASHRYLYTVNEVGDYKGEKSGGVSAFAIDRATGKLTFLNEVSSHGADPCHLSFDKTGKYLLVANYTGGSVAVFPVLADGRLGEASSVIQHSGHGPNAERQEGPHAHEIQTTADNRFVVASDLGLDELLVYRFDAAKGVLTANDPPFGKTEPGAGPRHFVFGPSEKFVYALNEIGGSVTSFAFDARTGGLQKLETTSSLAKDYKGKNDSAEIVAEPAGKHLYASNRGPDDIAVFDVDSHKGALQLVEHVPTRGKAPRNFAIDPTGKYLFAANQESNNIVVFRIDPKTGRLTDTGQVIGAPAPVCLVFLSAE
ncbi:MAG TPA: lactonase family protein [Terriglobales bacterium]|nr:lactonase family protein [Terriglobales bacterium]